MATDNPFSNVLAILVIIVGFCMSFAVIWIFVVWLIGRMAGWPELARRYPATMPRPAVQGSQTMQVGMSRYRHAMEIATNSLGIWLQPHWAFRAGHKPLFIPWSELSNPRPTVVRREDLVKLDVGMPTLQTIALPGAILQDEPAAAHLVLSR